MLLSDNNLIWLDLEMTGLNPEQDRILEIATVVTDTHLNILAEGPVLAIHQPDQILVAMDEWNTKQHQASGLTQRVRASQVDILMAEQLTLDFIYQYVPAQKSPLCGNSIWQDRRFLCRYMPKFENYCHYRNIDVSTLKELMHRWRPDLKAGFHKTSQHRALDDIRESIQELVYYREHFLRLKI